MTFVVFMAVAAAVAAVQSRKNWQAAAVAV
jgi:hypothetical protein